MASELDIILAHIECPPIDLAAVFSDLGVEYFELPIPGGASSWIERDRSGYRVAVNSTENEERRRFAAAHQLAHYVMHRDLIPLGRAGRHIDFLFDEAPAQHSALAISKDHDRYASKLAVQIITPAQKIRELSRAGATTDEIAATFAVSPKVIEIRLRGLRLPIRDLFEMAG